jgi:parallel beta-helix repeat protein
LIAAAAVAVAGVVAVAAYPAGGKGRVIEVRPGQLRAALERASNGDTLVLHHGRYRGSFVIDKRLRLIGAAGEPRPVIDGRCGTDLTIAVRHDGVVLRRLEVVGADEGFGPFPSEVDFRGVASGRAESLVVRDTCDAEYGINVYLSREVDVDFNRGRGFSDAAIYIGGITNTGDGALRVVGNTVFSNNRGIIVEDSAGGRIRVLENMVRDNTASGEGDPSGIFLHNSDGVLLRANQTLRNGRYGVHLDPNSDLNRLFDNASLQNPGGNFRDEGSGNCGARNSPNPFPPC